jgi:hypothetical protein
MVQEWLYHISCMTHLYDGVWAINMVWTIRNMSYLYECVKHSSEVGASKHTAHPHASSANNKNTFMTSYQLFFVITSFINLLLRCHPEIQVLESTSMWTFSHRHRNQTFSKLQVEHMCSVVCVRAFPPVGGYVSSLAPHYAILLCGSSTRVQCGRSRDKYVCF